MEPGDDLTANVPGGGAATRAAELREGTPVVLRALDRLAGVRTDGRSWAEGAKGERKVAKALAKLERRGWMVLHDVTVGTRGANIDTSRSGGPAWW